MENYYVMNKETQKLELHFNKDDYMALSSDQKQSVKSNFLFSRKSGAWVSRAKFPNLYRAEEVAKKLGLENAGKIGEKLSFEEQMERKAERAEARAERYDYKSERAAETGKSLQKPINDMHGDIAFFTQPNINSSAGRAFTRRREKMFAAYERGFEEGAAYVKASLSTEKKPEKANEHEETLFAEENIPETQPDANEHGFDFVLNKNSKRFHKPECTSVSTMKEENREYYSGSREELIAKGYKPCGSCNP